MLGLFKHKVVEEECEPLMTLEEFQAVRRKENDFLNPAALEDYEKTLTWNYYNVSAFNKFKEIYKKILNLLKKNGKNYGNQ